MDNNNNTSPVDLVALMEDPAALQDQIFEDSLFALSVIRDEIRDKGWCGTQKLSSYVALTKVVMKMTEDRKAEAKPDVISRLLQSLPFHEEGVDSVIELPTGR
jgi:hypothetical protein